MPTYKCHACSYSTTVKSNMNKHKQSAKHIKKAENYKGKTLTASKKKHNHSETKSDTNSDNKNKCQYCDKVFSNNSNLLRHEQHNCKQNRSNIIDTKFDKQNDINKKFEDKINELESQINELKNIDSLKNGIINIIIKRLDETNKNLTDIDDGISTKINDTNEKLKKLIDDNSKTIENIRNSFGNSIRSSSCSIYDLQNDMETIKNIISKRISGVNMNEFMS